MLEDRREVPCQTLDMSPGNMAIVTPIIGSVGERAVANVDHVGRIEGEIARTFEGGFAMTLNTTARNREKLAAKLTWLANRHELELPEDRRHDRIVPEIPVAGITLPDERIVHYPILDLSLSGASFASHTKPPIGALIRIGALHATIIRHSDEGFAVEFASVQTRESLAVHLP